MDISSAVETTEFPLEIYLPDGIEIADQSKDISIKVVLKELASHQFEISSSRIGLTDAAEGLKGAAEEKTITVTVKGKDSVLETLTEDDIRMSASLDGLSEGVHDVTIRVTCDKEADSIEVSPKKISVTVREE